MSLVAGAVIAKFQADLTDFNKGIAQVQKDTNSFVSGVVKGSAVMLTAFTAVAGGLAVIAKEAVKNADAYEQSNMAFTTMLGSADKAKQLLEDLAQMAKKTPFELQGIEQTARQLLAMGIEYDKLLPTLKMVGDASSALNYPLERIAFSLGQVKAQGRLTGIELREFAMGGLPLLDELSKNLGKTTGEIRDMVSAGEIGYGDVEKAFQTMTGEGGRFFNMMEVQSKSFSGQVSNLRDEWSLFLRDVGKDLIPVAKQFVVTLRTEVIPAIRELYTFLKNNQPVLIGIAVAITTMIIPAVYSLGVALWTALAPILPFVAIVVAVGVALGVLAYLIASNWDLILAKFEEARAWIGTSILNIQMFFTNLGLAFEATKQAFLLKIQEIVAGFLAFVTKVGEIVNMILAPFYLMAEIHKWIWDNLFFPVLYLVFAIIARILYEIGQLFYSIFVWIRDNVVMPIWNAIAGYITTKINEIKTIVNIVLLALQAIFNVIFSAIVAIAKQKWEEFRTSTITPIQNAYNQAKAIFDLIRAVLLIAINGMISDVKAWASNFVASIVKPFLDAKAQIEKIAGEIRKLADEINPFKKHSPSLVENVQRGLGIIKDEYASLEQSVRGLDFRGAMSALKTDVGFSTTVEPAQAKVINQNVYVTVNDALDIQTLSERLAFSARNS